MNQFANWTFYCECGMGCGKLITMENAFLMLAKNRGHKLISDRCPHSRPGYVHVESHCGYRVYAALED